MSYLNNTRLVFSGTFQADISTVNNDVRHFDNSEWEARFQEFAQPDRTENGWFNPVGSGAFRLIGCQIKRVYYQDGTKADTTAADPAVGLLIGGANDRVAAKLVDLDPQWQMASQIWGLKIRLTTGKEPPLAQGAFLPSAFRDLTFARIHVSPGNDRGASSSFQSVLEGLEWSSAADDSRALRELKELAASDSLSMRLMTFGYVGGRANPRFTLGNVCGVIGPYLANEPKTFVLGRRFIAADANLGRSWNGINYFTGTIDETSSTLLLDLGNALQFSDNAGTMNDIGTLTVGILSDPSLAEQAAVTSSNFELLGEINYKEADWIFDSSGIAAVPLSAAQLARALAAPLALAAEKPAGSNLIAMRENTDCLMSCPEEFVQRIDTPGPGNLTIYTARFGKPLAGANVSLTLLPRLSGLGGGQDDAPNQPKATIPDIGIPQDAITIPEGVVSDASGRASVQIEVASLDKPRGYLDGQIYLVAYSIDGEAASSHPQRDLIIVHARDAYTAPAKPKWMPDIAEIFTQFGNIYPIMSQRLVDLSDPVSVMQHLKALQLAFSLDIGDPNYMPVTRDLSASKQAAIRRWLDRLETEGDSTFVGGPRVRTEMPAGAELAAAMAAEGAAEPLGGKTTFALGLQRARAAQDSN